MYVCMHVSIYAYMYVGMFEFIQVYLCMYVYV